MKQNYKKLGEYIQPVDVRNLDFKRCEFEMLKKDAGNKCHTDSELLTQFQKKIII